MSVQHLVRERFFPHLWCPGCGHGMILNALLHQVDAMNFNPSSLVMD